MWWILNRYVLISLLSLLQMWAGRHLVAMVNSTAQFDQTNNNKRGPLCLFSFSRIWICLKITLHSSHNYRWTSGNREICTVYMTSLWCWRSTQLCCITLHLWVKHSSSSTQYFSCYYIWAGTLNRFHFQDWTQSKLLLMLRSNQMLLWRLREIWQKTLN